MHYGLNLPNGGGDPRTLVEFAALTGSPRDPDWEQERARIRSLAEAGMTWWIEYVPPAALAAMRAAIARGPLHVD